MTSAYPTVVRAALCVALPAALVLLAPTTLDGQTPSPQPTASLPTAGGTTVTASLRTRGEAWDWFGTEAAGEYAFVGATLRAGVSQQRPRLGWQVEVEAPVLLDLPDDAVAAAPRGQLGLGGAYAAVNRDENAAGLFVKQAYLRVGAAPGTAGAGVRAGRFEFAEGAEVAPADATLAALKRDRIAHRLLGTFGWSHVGRSFDGVHAAVTRPRWNATAVAARPTQGVFSVNGGPGLDVAVGYGALTLRDRPGDTGEARLFALHLRDDRDAEWVVKTDNRPIETRRADREEVAVTTLGGHYLRVMRTPAGAVDALLWGAWQTGDWGRQEHRAWAGDAELGFQPAALPALRPWLRVGHHRSSGDGDAADGRHGTFFQNLPTPRLHARMPFYNGMNLSDTFASLILRPGPRLILRGDVRRLGLESADDLWYSGGGAFDRRSFGFAGRPSNGADHLATLLDVSAELRATPRLTATLYHGHARGGDVVRRLFGADASGSLTYLELEYRR